jgi:TonB family protein
VPASLFPRPRPALPAWTWLASLGLHTAVVVGVGLITYYHWSHNEPAEGVPNARAASVVGGAMGLPGFTDGTILVDREPDPSGDPPRPSGGDTTPRLDTQKAGLGGDPTVRQAAIHLADKDELVRFSPDPMSRLDRDQEQRLRSSTERRAWEDRRATKNPMELTFLASGDLERMERRTPSVFDPSRGALSSPSAAVRGGDVGEADRGEGEEAERRKIGASRLGSVGSAPGTGVRDGKVGVDHLQNARVAHGRPDVTQGPTTVPAAAKGRPNDDVDSEQEVKSRVGDFVHASTAGGAIGDGRGGSGGGGDPGAGGANGGGSHARPLGVGDGDFFDLDTRDPRLSLYFRRVHKKIDPLWANAFPKSAMFDLKQGTVILEFLIAQDGTVSVTWPPLRPSGIDEFDRNCADALRRASPLEPPPKELGHPPLRVRAPFTAINPIVK